MRNIIRSIWTLCFLGGAFNHARDIFYGGWLPYHHVDLPVNVYWTALLPLDLLAALLVWIAPRLGAYLGVFIMISDVVINGWVVWGAGYSPISETLILQGIFLGFVLLTFRKVANGPSAPFRDTPLLSLSKGGED